MDSTQRVPPIPELEIMECARRYRYARGLIAAARWDGECSSCYWEHVRRIIGELQRCESTGYPWEPPDTARQPVLTAVKQRTRQARAQRKEAV